MTKDVCNGNNPEKNDASHESLMNQELHLRIKILELYLKVRPSLELLDELNTSIEMVYDLLNQLAKKNNSSKN